MKKIFLGLRCLCLSSIIVPSTTWANPLEQDPHYEFLNNTTTNQPTPDEIIRNEETRGFVQELAELFGMGNYIQGENTLFGYIVFIINLLLGLAAFIALVWLIYGFYRMFFVPYDSGIAKAREIIKGAVIALVVIGLSWVITRFLFWIVSLFVG